MTENCNAGFAEASINGQFILHFVMPHELRDVFCVRLYGKSRLLDEADGDPAYIWPRMSAAYSTKPLLAPQQVHSTNIIASNDIACSLPVRPEADGIYVDDSSVCAASLRFADCVPVVIAGCFPKPWLYILHSGFAGTCQNIVMSAEDDFAARFNMCFCGNNHVWAWIGPGITSEYYCRSQKDDKTIKGINNFASENFFEKDGKIYFDIKGQIKSQLISSGLSENNIYVSSGCTVCSGNKYYSYRNGDLKRRLFLLAVHC